MTQRRSAVLRILLLLGVLLLPVAVQGQAYDLNPRNWVSLAFSSCRNS